MYDPPPTARSLRTTLFLLLAAALVLIGFLAYRTYVEFQRGTPVAVRAGAAPCCCATAK